MSSCFALLRIEADDFSKRKQAERANKIASLPADYVASLTPSERSILNKPIQDLVAETQNGTTNPIDTLHAYGKVAVEASLKTNCLTEICFPEAETWIEKGEIDLKGPLAGIPVSVKDTVHIAGFDTSVGYSAFTGKPQTADGGMVKLLKSMGAVPFVKTAVPITLLSFESTNDVWGKAVNPHKPGYSPGGSTGGEGALLAFGGSRIGIGSDVAGSVRAPAHFSGCYSIRCSVGRWPKAGVNTSMPGQEGIPSVFSPMARTLNDLTYFARAMIQAKPWRIDHTVHPLEWREGVEKEYKEKSTLKVGVMRDDGVVTPAPACARALSTVVNALKAEGHEVRDVYPPSPYEALVIASQLLCSDGCTTYRSFFRTGEWNDRGADQMESYMNLPRPVRYLYYLYVRYIKGDRIWAGLIKDFHHKTGAEYWELVARREAYKARWFEWWTNQDIDVLLTPPNATPAVPHEGMKQAVSSCGYTFLFNLVSSVCIQSHGVELTISTIA